MGRDAPFSVERRWFDDKGLLGLSFRIANRSDRPLEIGALGMPMVFDNILIDRSLEQAHTQASFVDPYIGRDAGYLQVTLLNGHGPALLVLPRGTDSPLEAYSPLKNPREAEPGSIFTDTSTRGQTSAGFYDWTVHSAALSYPEWKHAGEHWNATNQPTPTPPEATR